MTMAADKQDKVLNFSSEREQSGACSSSAEREKNQGKNFLNVPNKRVQNQTCLNSAERSGLRPKGNVPTLRFPEYSDKWLECELQDIADLSKGAGISKDQLSETGESCILYGELYTKYKSEVISNVVSKTNIESTNLVRSKANDVIIPSSGETAIDISTARCVPYDNILLGGDLNIIRLKDQDGRFFSYQLNGVRKLDIAQIAQGVSVVHLYGESLKRLKVRYPSKSEQEKISSLLSVLDERIETQNRIINELQSLIIGLEQTLLKPQSNWTSCFIGDVLSIGSGRDYKHLSKGDIPVYGTGGYMLSVNDFLYDGESVCIGRKGTIDKPLYLHCKFWTVDTLFYTYDFREILPRYCYYLFNTINWLKYNEASGVPSLSKDTIERIKISIPSIEEQKRVSDIIDSVDEKLSLENTFLEKMISLKQFLLSSLFV